MSEKFPQMIYHPALEPIIVKNEAELKAHIDQGWSMVPYDQTPLGMIDAKIAWHTEQIEILQQKRDELDPPKKHSRRG